MTYMMAHNITDFKIGSSGFKTYENMKTSPKSNRDLGEFSDSSQIND